MRFATVLTVRRSFFALRVAWAKLKFAFRHSFERPTFTFGVKGCFAEAKFVLRQTFERPTFTFCFKGCLGEPKICVSPQL